MALRSGYFVPALARRPLLRTLCHRRPSASQICRRVWEHGPGKPGGRKLCYFDGDDAVIVWTHARLGQASHRDILAIAQEGGTDHARLAAWWAVQHHLIGKVE